MTLCLGSTTLAWAQGGPQSLPLKTHPDSKNWQDLFAADLSDAVFPAGIWSFESGVLTATEDKNIWTKKTYNNFILDLEFKTSEGSNSGVFVHGSDISDAGWLSNSVEVQILDDYSKKWADIPPTWRCGDLGGSRPRIGRPGPRSPPSKWSSSRANGTA